MKLLHIIGTIVAINAATFILAFVMPGCRSTTRKSPSPSDTTVSEPSPNVAYPLSSSAVTNQGDLQPTSSLHSGPSIHFAGTEPAAIRYNPTRPGNPATTTLTKPERNEVAPATTYTVALKDNLWSIAKKFKITQAELAAANNLALNAQIGVGKKLIIPTKATPQESAAQGAPAVEGDVMTYTVRSGDSLELIAKRSGSTKAALYKLNKLSSDIVRPGQQLILPASLETASKLAATPNAAAKPVADPKTSVTHTVRSGETLDQIARKYGVPARGIATLNRIPDPKKLVAGKVITIPGVSASATPVSTPPAVTSPTYSPAVIPTTPIEQPLVAPAQDSGLVSPAPANDFSPPVIKVDDSAPLISPSK